VEGDEKMEFIIPQSLRTEHEELHAELKNGTKEAGKIGEAAQPVAAGLHPHFLKEEEYALPSLGLLAPLAREEFNQDMLGVLEMTNRLKQDLGQMAEEHKAIVAQLEGLTDAARKSRKYACVRFAETLVLHAGMEEQVLYPAAILIGEHLKSRRDG
jgi:Hemerythrin HHE cation binding domain